MQDAHLTGTEAQQLRTLAGQLNWTSSQTCPDISYQACEVSTCIKNATICDLKTANKYIRKLKSLEVVLKFPNLGNLENVRIMCSSDASFANLKNGSSHGGFIIFLCGNAPIAWKSNKLKGVVKSTLSAETLALEEALESSFMIKSLLCELLNKEMKSGLFQVYCYTDNKSLVDTINSTKALTEKRLKADVCIIREMTEKQEVKSVSRRDSSSQLTDCLTKVGASSEKRLHAFLKGNAN